VLVFKDTNLEIYGAGKNRSPDIIPSDVIVDLADNYGKAIECHGIFKELEKYSTRKMIKISWPDMSVPRMHPKFWAEFAEMIRAHTKPLSLVFICNGGHGRTGTALCIIGCLLGLIPEDVCPVEYVRGIYCDQIVETDSQIKYIKNVTGREVTATKREYYRVGSIPFHGI